MRQVYLQHLQKLTGNPQALVEAIIQLLSDSTNPLTFEELYECCSEKPPLQIHPNTLFSIAIRCMDIKNIEFDNIFKLAVYAKSKNVIDAYYFIGVCLEEGYSTQQNVQAALEDLLYFYNEKTKTDRLKAILDAGIRIARLYVKKTEHEKALKYFLEYFTHYQIEESKKDEVLPEILDVYFKINQDNIYEGIIAILRIPNLNWDKVWEYIHQHKNDYLTSPAKGSMARLLFLFPLGHAKKTDADKLAIEILQRFLDSLYPKVEKPPSKDESDKKLPAKVERNVKGWVFNIDDTLLDGYDFSLLSEEIFSLEKNKTEYEFYKNRYKKLRDQKKEAREEGYNSTVISRIKSELASSKKKKLEAKTALNETQQKLEAIQFAARRKERDREYKVQQRFFDPARTQNSQTRQIARNLQSNRLTLEESQALPLTQIPSRRVITAERSTIQASYSTLGVQSKFSQRNQLGWINNKNETVTLDSAVIKYYQNPGEYPNHLGNYFLTIPGLSNGDYEEILPFLHKISQTTKDYTHKENEIKIAKLILDYAKSGVPITTQQLKSINANSTDQDCMAFNSICYHLIVKEVARRMPCHNNEYDFPSAIVQARAIQLIARGFLTLEDVFGPDAPYGVVTGKKLFNNHASVILKINRVNRLYNEKIYGISLATVLTLYTEEHPKGRIIASQKLLRKELQETYGASEDTDGEGYSSEEESALQPPAP